MTLTIKGRDVEALCQVDDPRPSPERRSLMLKVHISPGGAVVPSYICIEGVREGYIYFGELTGKAYDKLVELNELHSKLRWFAESVWIQLDKKDLNFP